MSTHKNTSYVVSVSATLLMHFDGEMKLESKKK